MSVLLALVFIFGQLVRPRQFPDFRSSHPNILSHLPCVIHVAISFICSSYFGPISVNLWNLPLLNAMRKSNSSHDKERIYCEVLWIGPLENTVAPSVQFIISRPDLPQYHPESVDGNWLSIMFVSDPQLRTRAGYIGWHLHPTHVHPSIAYRLAFRSRNNSGAYFCIFGSGL